MYEQYRKYPSYSYGSGCRNRVLLRVISGLGPRFPPALLRSSSSHGRSPDAMSSVMIDGAQANKGNLGFANRPATSSICPDDAGTFRSLEDWLYHHTTS